SNRFLVAVRIHAENTASARTQVARDVAHEFNRRGDGDLDDGLEQARPRFKHGLVNGKMRGNFEGHFRGVDVVIRTIEKLNDDIPPRKARDDAAMEGFFAAFVHGGNVLPRHRATDDAVDKFISAAARVRRQPDMHVAVLAMPTRLLLVLAAYLRLAFDRFL